MKIIAHIENSYEEKFGVSRQSGLAEHVLSRIVFEPEYRVPAAFRGLEEYSHLWLLWCFSANEAAGWSPTVRPPVLGGNKRMGVFATRSPFRPNQIGLSSVRLVRVVCEGPEAPYLEVAGADLLDGTPVYDVKPYLPYTDAHPEAAAGFSEAGARRLLSVHIPAELASVPDEQTYKAIYRILQLDPRPSYQKDSSRIYGMSYGGYDIKFTVTDKDLFVKYIGSGKQEKPWEKE